MISRTFNKLYLLWNENTRHYSAFLSNEGAPSKSCRLAYSSHICTFLGTSSISKKKPMKTATCNNYISYDASTTLIRHLYICRVQLLIKMTTKFTLFVKSACVVTQTRAWRTSKVAGKLLHDIFLSKHVVPQMHVRTHGRHFRSRHVITTWR